MPRVSYYIFSRGFWSNFMYHNEDDIIWVLLCTIKEIWIKVRECDFVTRNAIVGFIAFFSLIIGLPVLVLKLGLASRDLIFDRYEDAVVFGDENSQHTLIYYYSFDCDYCRDFILNIMPNLMNKYSKNNYLKIILREVPINDQELRFSAVMRFNHNKYYLVVLKEILKEINEKKELEKIFNDLEVKRDFLDPVDFLDWDGLFLERFKSTHIDKKVKQHAKNVESMELPLFVIDNVKFNRALSSDELQYILAGRIAR